MSNGPRIGASVLAAAIGAIYPQNDPPRFSLRYLGDPALRVICKSVSDWAWDVAVIDAMFTVVRKYSAAGLAANQVGGHQRIIVVAFGAGENWRGAKLRALINPVITFRSPEIETAQEGCLSMPRFYTTLPRHRQVRVEYVDMTNKKCSETVAGFDARCVQHEIDHLDGKLIVDGLSRQQRRQAERLTAKAAQ